MDVEDHGIRCLPRVILEYVQEDGVNRTRLFQQFRIYEWLILAPETNKFCHILLSFVDILSDQKDEYSNSTENSGSYLVNTCLLLLLLLRNAKLTALSLAQCQPSRNQSSSSLLLGQHWLVRQVVALVQREYHYLFTMILIKRRTGLYIHQMCMSPWHKFMLLDRLSLCLKVLKQGSKLCLPARRRRAKTNFQCYL